MEDNKSSDVHHTSETARIDGEKEMVNSSGHVQEIDRTFSVVSICAMGVLTDNVSIILSKARSRSHLSANFVPGLGRGFRIARCFSVQVPPRSYSLGQSLTLAGQTMAAGLEFSMD